MNCLCVAAFEEARGYKIERQPFIEDIVSGKEIQPQEDLQDNQRNRPEPNYEDIFEHRRKHNHRQNDIAYGYRDSYLPPVPYYPRSNMDYQSPLAGSSYDEYEASSRHSRGYGNPRGARGSYQGYSQYRNNPYGRPNNYSNVRQGPFKEQTGRYGNRKWTRNAGPPSDHSER